MVAWAEAYGQGRVLCMMPFTGFSTSSTLTLCQVVDALRDHIKAAARLMCTAPFSQLGIDTLEKRVPLFGASTSGQHAQGRRTVDEHRQVREEMENQRERDQRGSRTCFHGSPR